MTTAEAAVWAAVHGAGVTRVWNYNAAEAVRDLQIVLERLEPEPQPVQLDRSGRGNERRSAKPGGRTVSPRRRGDSPAGGCNTRPRPIAREAMHVYTECAAIWNPIHTERALALAAGLPDIILHGKATWALAGLEILRRCASGDAARLKRISGRFSNMIIPCETIGIRHALVGGGVIRCDALTVGGQAAISQGFAVVEDVL